MGSALRPLSVLLPMLLVLFFSLIATVSVDATPPQRPFEAGLPALLSFAWRGRIEFERAWTSTRSNPQFIQKDTIGKVESVAQDTEGNSYVCGSFEGNTKFSSSSGLSSTVETFFLAKYSASGDLVFALESDKTISKSSNSVVSGCKHVGVRADGDVVVAGWFSGSDFGLGGYGVTLGENENSQETTAVFVARVSFKTGKVIAFQELITCTSRNEPTFGVTLQSAYLDCRSGKMSLAASLKGFCMVTTKSSGSRSGSSKEAIVANGDGIIMVLDDHVLVEFRQPELYNIAIIRSPSTKAEIVFDSVTVGAIHNGPDSVMPNTHHDKSTESHSTEIRAYAAIKVRSLEMVGSYDIVLDKDTTIQLTSTHSIIVASYVWKASDPANGINLWNHLFEEHNIAIKQLVLNNPTYKDAITEHRPEEMLYVLGSSSWPFLKKLNATDGSSLWMKTIRPTFSPAGGIASIPHFEVDSIQFYRTLVALSGRVQLMSTPESSKYLLPNLPFSIQVGNETDQLAKQKPTQKKMLTTPTIAFLATIPQTFVNSETQENATTIQPKTFVATNFASVDSRVLLSSDVTNDVALFVVALATVTPESHRYEFIDGAEQNTPNEPAAFLYMGRTIWIPTRSTDNNGEASTVSSSTGNEQEASSFLDMMLRVHHHHPDWETRLGLKGASSAQVFLAFTLCVAYIVLVIAGVRWIRRNVSLERVYASLPPPAFAS